MFDPLSQPLRGTHSIEASAGTGKTFSITVLWLRLLVEEKLPVEQILVSTFTRAATAELKERLLRTLQRALQSVDGSLPGSGTIAPTPPEQSIVQSAIADGLESRDALRKRLGEALSSFDLAPISTIHGFCQTLISRHALELGCDPGLTLVEDSGDLLDQIVSDTVLSFAHESDAEPDKLPSLLGGIAPAIASRPYAAFHADPNSPAQSLHDRIRTELPVRKALAGIRTFDDILTIVHDALETQGADGMLAQSVRKRLSAAIIDECQDSDTIQIKVFQTLFHHPDVRSFIVIGDPKQSIYRFRGADLTSYKELARAAKRAPQMSLNHRSDAPLIAAINRLYGDHYTFPDSSNADSPTGYIPVSAKCNEARISDPDLVGALVLNRASSSVRNHAKGEIVSWLGTECERLLGRTTKIKDRHSQEERRLLPGDIAVIAATKSDLNLVRHELLALRIPCQIDGKGLGSVFQSDEALDILAWLELNEALSESGDTLSKLCGFLATPLGCSSATQIVAIRNDPAHIAALCDRFRKTASRFDRSGPLPALIDHLSQFADTHLDHGRDRRVTNWRHIGSLLQTQFARGMRSPAALADWLNRRSSASDSAQDDSEAGSSLMRLETDEPAIQLLTIHASKGLEFPVVFCPFLWHVSSPRSAKARMKVATLRESTGWKLDARKGDPQENRDKALAQEKEEEYRKLYVALTRARHRLYVGIADIADSRGGHLNGSARSPLLNLPRIHEVLEGALSPRASRDPANVIITDTTPIRLNRVPAKHRAADEASTSMIPEPIARPENSSLFTKRSFSSLARSSTAGEDASHVPDRDLEVDPAEASVSSGEGILKELGKAGSELGDRLHRALEDHLGNGRSIPEIARSMDPAEKWELALETITRSEICLGEVKLRLGDIRNTAITEMQFHMPTDHFSPTALSQALLSDPLISKDEVRDEWARAIAGWRFERFSGFLQGFIDLIFEKDGRWYIVDYKSNRLPSYDPESIDSAMLHHHYLLQSRIYCAALHRHLTHHVADYSPDTHFGGVVYLFVRDMPKGGTWFERPEPTALRALSDLFNPPR